jgi:homoserine O-acetyltransferase
MFYRFSSSSYRSIAYFLLNVPRAPPRLCSSRNFASFTAPPPVKPLQTVTLPDAFSLHLGGSLPSVSIHVECLGDPALPLSRTVVVFPSFSHSSHVAGHTHDPSPGWWQHMVGPGLSIDTRFFRVLCPSVLGSPYSPTNPAATKLRAAFPAVTPTDLARCHAAVLDALLGPRVGVPFHAVVGASLGGMQALQFASLFPGAARRVVAVAATGRTTPFTVAVRSTQRRAITRDPHFLGGNYADAGVVPEGGLRTARELGTMFYRSRAEFDSRFSWAPRHGGGGGGGGVSWEVEDYLAHAGAKFVHAFDANAYLLLSRCMDLMDLGDGAEGRSSWAEGARRIAGGGATRALLVGVKQDALIPPSELQALAGALGAAAEYAELDSEMGHDAFLVPRAVPELGARVRAFLEEGEEGLRARLLEESALVGGPSC